MLRQLLLNQEEVIAQGFSIAKNDIEGGASPIFEATARQKQRNRGFVVPTVDVRIRVLVLDSVPK